MRLGLGLGLWRRARGGGVPGDVSARAAGITITGQPAGIGPIYVNAAAAGITMTSQTALLSYDLQSAAGGITIAGQQASIGIGGEIDVALANIAIAGQTAAIGSSTQISATAAGITIAGQTATVDTPIQASAAGITIAAQAATVTTNAAPVITSVTFTDNNDGTPADLAIVYTGDVTGYRIYMASGSATFDSTVPTPAQLYAGAGATGADEYDDVAVGTNIPLTGFTSASESSTRIAVCFIKSADGSAPSNVVVRNVSGLDFTAPTFSSAEVGNIDGSTLEITATETLLGTPNAADFTLTGNTISGASIVGGKIRLTLGTEANTGDDYTGDLSYTQSLGSIVDADGNELANFASQNVTNNTSGPTFVSAEVGNVDAGTLVITASETLSGTPNAADFTLTGNTISGATITAGKVYLTLGTTATSGDDYTGDLSYTQSAGSIQNAAGSELENFASQNVTNNVSAGSTIELPFAPTVATGTDTSGSVSLGTTEAGDEIILALVGRSVGTITWPSNFTSLVDGTGGTTAGAVYTARWDQTGTRPSGGSLSVSWTSIDAFVLYCFVVRNSTNTLVSAGAGGTGSDSFSNGPITANGDGLLLQIYGTRNDENLTITAPGTPPSAAPGSYPATEGYFDNTGTADTAVYITVQDNTDYSAGSVSGTATVSSFANVNRVIIEVT